jgi:hypothetical protein
MRKAVLMPTWVTPGDLVESVLLGLVHSRSLAALRDGALDQTDEVALCAGGAEPGRIEALAVMPQAARALCGNADLTAGQRSPRPGHDAAARRQLLQVKHGRWEEPSLALKHVWVEQANKPLRVAHQPLDVDDRGAFLLAKMTESFERRTLIGHRGSRPFESETIATVPPASQHGSVAIGEPRSTLRVPMHELYPLGNPVTVDDMAELVREKIDPPPTSSGLRDDAPACASIRESRPLACRRPPSVCASRVSE